MSPYSAIRGVVMAFVYLTCALGAIARAESPLVIFLGDSLTAGYGLPAEQAFPALVGDALNAKGTRVRVVNAGVSGDTTSGGLARLDWLLDQKPRVLVVGLGANDALRGQPVERIEANLREIIRAAKVSGARVVLLGMRVPTNYGPDFADAFASLYGRVAKDERVDLVPFLLAGVGGKPALNLDDGVHPNAEGQRVVAANVIPYVERAVKRP